MEIRRYVDSDYTTVSGWYRERNMIPVPKDMLPPTGIFIPGIACAHICFTDSNVAFFEGFISNPETSHRERKEALDMTIDYFMRLAKDRGCKGAFVLCQHPTISKGCKEARFSDLGEHRMFFRELS